MKRIYLNNEESKYFITEKGKVISTAYKGAKGYHRVLKDSPDNDKYRIITLNHKGKKYTRKIHRLVAEAFIPNPDNLPQVNHIDGDKCNNCVENLEWVDCASNIHHAIDHKLRYSISNSNKILAVCDMLESTDKTFKSIAEECGVSKGVVTRVKEKKAWKNIVSDRDFSNREKKVYHGRGEKNPSSVITDKQAHEVCKLMVAGKSPTAVADILNIPRSIVYSIHSGKAWQCVSQYYIF